MKAAWILAASALAMASCAKEEILAPEEQQANKITVNITAGSIDTRTHYDGQIIDGKTQIKWDGGETLKLLENGIKFATATSDAGTTADNGVTAQFTANLTSGATGPFDYYAVYPSESYATSSNTDVAKMKLVLSSEQHPLADSFDPTADLLVSKGVHLDAQPTNLSFQFARPIAIMEMTVKGLTDGETISSVEFTSETAILSGRLYYDFTNNKVIEYGYQGQAFKSINCIYDTPIAVNAIEGNKIYFTVFPTGDKPKNALADFTVTVNTDKATYTKSVTPPTALTIKPNELVKFSVAGLTREEKIVDEYLLLTNASILTEGYKLIITNGTDGSIQAMGDKQQANNRMDQVAITAANNKITSVPNEVNVITLEGTTDNFLLKGIGGYISLNGNQNELKYIASAKDASKWKISIATKGNTDIISGTRPIRHNSNGYFASYKGTTSCDPIYIFYKEGTPRTPLATPTGLTATVAEGTNVAQVSWTAVTDAASYTVTCGENVQTVNATTATFEGLNWETTYNISVVANQGDTDATHKPSEAATTTVTIGANPEQANASIKDLRTKLGTQDFDITTYCGGSMTAIFAGEYSGNYVVVDNTGEAGSGIILRTPKGGNPSVGQKVTINFGTASLGEYKGLKQINNASITVEADAVVEINTPTITAAQLNSDAYQGMYVQINATTPSTPGTWADVKTMNDAANTSFSIHIAGDATFGTLPYAISKAGIIKGVATTFDTPQLQPIFESDIAAFIDTTPEFSLADAEISSAAGTPVEITKVTTKNIQEALFTVKSDAAWLTEPKIQGGQLIANVTENTSTTAARTATVTVTYTGAKVATQTITVTQLAKGEAPATKEYTLTITSVPGSGNSYNDYNGNHVYTATANDGSTQDITVNTNQVMMSSKKQLQFQAKKGTMSCTLPTGGTIKSVTYNPSDAGLTLSNTGNGFTLKKASKNAAYINSVTIVFEM